MIKDFYKKLPFLILGLFALIGAFFVAVLIGMQFNLFNVRGSISERNSFFGGAGAKNSVLPSEPCIDKRKTTCAWNETPEWTVIKSGLIKDKNIIARVARETGVSERMIVSVVVPEQTRFFTSEREIFKSYFEPLKILGSLSKFSLGVSGIKEETAKLIEKYASDRTSLFYPGDGGVELIKYAPGANHNAELYNRLTDAKNHYYSYLYTALYIKEVEAQWQKADYDISANPETVATLFNIGFSKSKPNAEPISGGAIITTGGRNYTYGELGASFYRSSELADIF